jgi:hypothetical protein
LPEITLVHSSSITPPLGLTGAKLFDERHGRSNLLLDGPSEFFRLLAEPLDVHD